MRKEVRSLSQSISQSLSLSFSLSLSSFSFSAFPRILKTTEKIKAEKWRRKEKLGRREKQELQDRSSSV